MNRIKWNPEWNTGITSIDSQHKWLVRLINEVKSSISNEECKAVFLKLAKYIDVHFKHEEDLFERTGYPKMFEHIQLHERLLESTVMLKDRLFNDPLFVKEEVSDFLLGWLSGHILQEDKEFSDYLFKSLDDARVKRIIETDAMQAGVSPEVDTTTG